jgi:CRISPR system Cascade subunit CasC
MKNNRLYVDIHILQTVPPSCVNRDDTGSPKTAMYGGAMRARVSSQSWKRAVRDMFKSENAFSEDNIGVRTKSLVKLIAGKIREIDPSIEDNNAEQFARDTINIASKKKSKPIIPESDNTNKKEEDEHETDKSSALFFITPIQAYAVAKLAVRWIKENTEPEKKAVVEALMKSYAVDIALFGRLVTQNPDLNIDACAQVAHSISTHKVNNEYDYFTAVDDMSDEDNAGAGHIGTVEFNSSTLYRYATVAVHELNRQLADETINAVLCFVKAFVSSMPTGKQNTFANRTLPDALLITLRKDQPINFVGAFEKPISASDEGYAAASAKRLTAHVMSAYKSFAKEPVLSLVIGELFSGLGNVQPLDDLINALKDALCEQMSNSGGLQ